MRADFAKSAYTSRGVLVAAQALQQRGDLDGAHEQLQWLVKADRALALRDTAAAETALRLADRISRQASHAAQSSITP